MIAKPCIIPIPNPPPAIEQQLAWQQEADFWQTQWSFSLRRKHGLRPAAFKSMYCRSDYAHMIAAFLGGS